RPRNQVSPGTMVTLQKLEEGTQDTFRILGPWDVTEPGIISYKAPYAASLLGAKVGDTVTVQLPGTSFDVKILSVEIL
ncbi:MAG: GreA/GreB family elongation factor, partial [Planctomycetes bacterium]|nr:GreA/GreB family elongation factor [Planctomycetota bacterium]